MEGNSAVEVRGEKQGELLKELFYSFYFLNSTGNLRRGNTEEIYISVKTSQLR